MLARDDVVDFEFRAMMRLRKLTVLATFPGALSDDRHKRTVHWPSWFLRSVFQCPSSARVHDREEITVVPVIREFLFFIRLQLSRLRPLRELVHARTVIA
ncbi:MAG TPA: hypothetical protein VL475_14010 [Planctomycetaceae bacterium]|nr:hypothetical protein [Planctomycetaceae bacterium]